MPFAQLCKIPCDCAGSVGYIHDTCLYRCISKLGPKCTVCHALYRTELKRYWHYRVITTIGVFFMFFFFGRWLYGPSTVCYIWAFSILFVNFMGIIAPTPGWMTPLERRLGIVTWTSFVVLMYAATYAWTDPTATEFLHRYANLPIQSHPGDYLTWVILLGVQPISAATYGWLFYWHEDPDDHNFYFPDLKPVDM